MRVLKISVNMASYASSLLDELMGRHRNANPDDKPKEPHWSDPEVIVLLLATELTSRKVVRKRWRYSSSRDEFTLEVPIGITV